MSDYYDVTGAPGTGTFGASSTIRAEFQAIEDGLTDKLPTITGNASKLVAVNAGATLLESVTQGTAQTIVGISAFGATLVDDTSATAARATLEAIIGTDVQAWTAVLDANTASFTTAQETKLDGIEALADVTDATNVVSSLSGATLTGALIGGDQTLSRVNLLDYGEVTNAIGSTGGGTQDIDMTLGNSVTATVDTSTNTFTFSNPTASDELCGFTLTLTNGGSQTVNWPASVDWAGATAPTLTAAGVDILVFFTVDGGTIWHGMISSTDSS